MKKKVTDQAPYFFHQGTNREAYRYLGCHLSRDGAAYRYVFRTWAPGATAVFLVSDFAGWDTGIRMQRVTDRGIWEVCVEHDASYEGAHYKFRIVRGDRAVLKGDPYAFYSAGGSDGASIIIDGLDGYVWHDRTWLEHRKKTVTSKNGSYLAAPLNIYEVHLASFARHEDGSYYTYRELADTLAPYVKSMGYTHVELMPVTEYPYDGSWGYQVTCFFAPTSRFGTPDDFRYFIDTLHGAGIGVIMDWVPAHFPKDEWGLYEFDGAPLYEYQGIDRMESRSWGTRFFDLGREEVQSFLVSSAMFWLQEYHIDGLRVDAVASMIYLDYDRMPGEWNPNPYGGNQNLEAVAFLQKLNASVFERFGDILMIAEESTDWGGITHPVATGGLGFNLKWNMGWANDFYRYLAMDPVYRRYHHEALNFPLMYAFRENYVLPISHDEVVHGKCSLIGKMNGSYDEKFAQMRCALMLMMTYPGKKMLFMGTEYAQFSEWNYQSGLEWFMLDYPPHRFMRDYVRSLNLFYLDTPALWEQDFRGEGFSWIYPDAADANMVAFRRYSLQGDHVVVVIGFSGSTVSNIRIPVEEVDGYRPVFDTGCGFSSEIPAKEDEGGAYITIDLPPMSGVILMPIRKKAKKKSGKKATAEKKPKTKAKNDLK